MQISYLAEHPEFIPTLGQWFFEHYGALLGEKTPDARIAKLRTHVQTDTLPIAWVAHADGQVLGMSALRVHDLDGREDLTPWLGGLFVGRSFRRQGIGAQLVAAVEAKAGVLGIGTLYLFTLDKQAWYSRLGWRVLEPCTWCGQPGSIMLKDIGT